MAASRSTETCCSKPCSSQSAGWTELMREGSRLMSDGQPEDAQVRFASAAKLRPGHVQTLALFGASLLRADKPEAALDVFAAILKLDPRHIAARHGKGLSLYHLGDRQAALATFRSAVRHCRQAWNSWRSIADLTPHEDERIAALQTTADALEGLCKIPSAPPRLYASCADALMHAHRFEDAARFVRANWSRFPDEGSAYDRLARASYRLGAFEQAFGHMTQALAAIAPEDVPASPAPRIFSPDAARGALQHIRQILDAHHVPFFLAAGTLLGFVRTGAPLAHDRDVDIGVFQDEHGAPDIAGILRAHPSVLLAPSARPGDRYFSVRCRSVAVDIFLHARRTDAVRCGFSHDKGDIQWRFSPFTVTRACFDAMDWMLPSPAEQYLAQTYGEHWQSPDTGFASVVNSPALFEVNPFARAYYSVARARKCRLTGDHQKADALLARSPIPVRLGQVPFAPGAAGRPIPRGELM